jgi:hypothetical protein
MTAPGVTTAVTGPGRAAAAAAAGWGPAVAR